MNTQSSTSLKERCRVTVEKLLETCQNRAARSALRPLLTGIPDMQIRAMSYLPKKPPVNEELLYMVAGLIAEYPYQYSLPSKPLSLGASLRILSQKSDINAPGIERRVELLLQLEQSTLAQSLHSLIVQSRSTETPIDYATLLYHLRFWDDPQRWVQLAWAKDFWCPREEDEADNNSSVAVS